MNLSPNQEHSKLISTQYRPPESHNNSQNFKFLLQKLGQLLEREKSCLQSGNLNMLESFAKDKMLMFVSLSHLSQSSQNLKQDEINRKELAGINTRLRENMDLLKLRISAISEITKTIEDSISEAESDGTYTSNGFK